MNSKLRTHLEQSRQKLLSPLVVALRRRLANLLGHIVTPHLCCIVKHGLEELSLHPGLN